MISSTIFFLLIKLNYHFPCPLFKSGGVFLTLLPVTGSEVGWSYLQKNISLYPSFASYSSFCFHDLSCSDNVTVVICIAPVPVSQRTVQDKHNSANDVRESTFCLLKNYVKKYKHIVAKLKMRLKLSFGSKFPKFLSRISQVRMWNHREAF